ncbi:unnamed protein product, partial [Adineta steineri]
MAQLIGLLSGLISALRIVIPIIVRFIVNKLNNVQSPPSTLTFRERLRLLKPALKKVIVELNTFQYFPHNDRQLQYQRYATRLYIFLIIISVTILAGYNLMDTSIHRHTVTNPSESQYLILEEDNPTDLICKCANISVSYSSFITIQPQLHQVCLSYLIKPEWMMHSDSQSWAAQNILDYRIAARKQFQTLAILCEQAKSCYPIEALFSSTLECFYNESCM